MRITVELLDAALTVAEVRIAPSWLGWLRGEPPRELGAVLRRGMWAEDRTGRVITDRRVLAELERSRDRAIAAQRLATRRPSAAANH